MTSKGCLRPGIRTFRSSWGHCIHHQSSLRPIFGLRRSVGVTTFPRNPQYFRTHASSQENFGWDDADYLQLSTKPIKVPRETLRINGNKIDNFQTGGGSDFSLIRESPGLVYFDRTRYISVLNTLSPDIMFFLRPPAFGKSLTISMLEYFHGVQHKDKYDTLFKDLDIDKDVKKYLAIPGRYFVLRVDFSGVERNPDLEVTAQKLGSAIIDGLKDFYTQYHKCWGRTAKDLIFNKVNVGNPVNSLNELVKLVSETLRKVKDEGDETHPLAGVEGVYLLADEYDAFTNKHLDSWSSTHSPALVRNFWNQVKYLMKLKFGISKCFITGITPLSLDDTSGFRLAKNVTHYRQLSGICGLTRSDLQAALENICASEDEVERHLGELDKYANGYRFCGEVRVFDVYNTGTCLEYLQAVLKKTPTSIQDPTNSEVPYSLLEHCAYSSVAMGEIQNALATEVKPKALQQPIYYSNFDVSITPTDLYSKIEGSEIPWRKLLLYFGGLTFDKEDPNKLLQVPNLIAARRFGAIILDRYGLRDSVEDAVKNLESEGNIIKALTCYRRMISQRDHKLSVYDWDEERHRDSFHISILSNPALKMQPGYRVITPEIVHQAGINSRVDLLVTTLEKLVFTHWETLGIDCLDLGDLGTREQKQKVLSELNTEQILDLKFNDLWFGRRYTKRIRIGKTIGSWLHREVSVWMRGYVKNRKVAMCGQREFRAYLVVVIASRRILVWELDEYGNRTNVRTLI